MSDVTISMQSHTISRRRCQFRVIHVLSRDGKRILDTRSHTDIPAEPLLSMCRRGKPGQDAPVANAPTPYLPRWDPDRDTCVMREPRPVRPDIQARPSSYS